MSNTHYSDFSSEGVNLSNKSHNFKQVTKMNKRFIAKMEREHDKKLEARQARYEAEMVAKYSPVDKKDKRNMDRIAHKKQKSVDKKEKRRRMKQLIAEDDIPECNNLEK